MRRPFLLSRSCNPGPGIRRWKQTVASLQPDETALC